MTDTITLQATVDPPIAGKAVKWTVVGTGPAAGISGFPTQEVHNTDSGGISTFMFRPADNAAFVTNRRTTWATASTQANEPIGFDVIAELDVDGHTVESRLSQLNLGSLLQDETDTLRQEYFDFQVTVPGRDAIVPSEPGYNNGNYHFQRNIDLPGHYDAIVSAYRGSTVIVGGQPFSIPPTADIAINSAFRCPRHNLAAGSSHPDSRHTQGSALDLSPVTIYTFVDGLRTKFDLHGNLYPALWAASATQGYAQAEKKGVKTWVGDPGEDHIHLQWGMANANALARSPVGGANVIQAHVVVSHTGTEFSYKLFNDEPASSPLGVNAFHLAVNAPVDVISSPAGWSFETDNRSYVDWSCNARTSPYVGDIAPGAFAEGFLVRSQIATSAPLGFAVVSWNQGASISGPGYLGTIESPSISGVVPLLSNISLTNDKKFQFTVIGLPSYKYAIESSPDLVNWSMITTRASPFTFVDANSVADPAGFYRAVFVPESSSPDDE